MIIKMKMIILTITIMITIVIIINRNLKIEINQALMIKDHFLTIHIYFWRCVSRTTIHM